MTISLDVAALTQRLRPDMPPERPLKVFYWPADVHSGCFMYRVDMPRRELLRLGHEVQASQTLGAWPREEADVIVGQRLCVTGPVSQWLILAQQKRRPALVYEVDDDLFNIDPDLNPAGAVFRQSNMRKNMIDALWAADLVTVSTEPLADLLRRYNPNVVVLPNCVDASVLTLPAPLRRGKDDDRVIYGWQGSPTHADDWETARPAVGDLLLAEERAHLKMLGTQYFDGLPLVDRGRLTFMPWTPDLDTHYKRVSRFDVALGPLAPTLFNRSKSALRAIECAALGVPIVVSDVPAYRGWVEQGVTGFLARNRQEWLGAMLTLRDPAARLEMGAAARERAAAWTIQANPSKWIEAYRAAAAGRSAV